MQRYYIFMIYNITISRYFHIWIQKKRLDILNIKSFFLLAEAGGFEPPVRLPVRQFSKLVVSATHPNFLPSRFLAVFESALSSLT